MEGEREFLREWIEVRYKYLIDTLELMSVTDTSFSESNENSGKAVFLEDAWKIFPESLRLLGVIEAYTGIYEDIEPEIREYKEDVSRHSETIMEKLVQLTTLYVEAENHYNQRHPQGDVEI